MPLADLLQVTQGHEVIWALAIGVLLILLSGYGAFKKIQGAIAEVADSRIQAAFPNLLDRHKADSDAHPQMMRVHNGDENAHLSEADKRLRPIMDMLGSVVAGQARIEAFLGERQAGLERRLEDIARTLNTRIERVERALLDLGPNGTNRDT